MKIYSNSVWDGPEHAEVKTPFDEFVGKNLWVACQYNERSNIEYVRFLYKDVYRDDWVVFTVDAMNKRTLDTYRAHPDYYNSKDPRHLTQHTEFDLRYLKLVDPVEIYTTEELFSMQEYSYDDSVITKFMNKPYWVRTNRTDDYGEYYVRFYDRYGDSIVCDWIETKFIDDYTYDSFDSYSEDWLQTGLLHIDVFDVIQPIDVLTDQEFQDAKSAAEDEYERGFWEDHDEEDDEDEE